MRSKRFRISCLILAMCFLVPLMANAAPFAAQDDPAFPDVPIPERTDRPVGDFGETYYKYPFQDPNLSIDERVDDLLGRLTIDEKVTLAHQYGAAVIRLGLKNFRTGSEGEHGVCWHGYATVFPQGTGLGLTFDKKLLEQIGYVVGTEMRAYNSVDDTFSSANVWSPIVDLGRDPRYGRASEGMGEDPYLTGILAKNYSDGMKGYDPFYWMTQPTLKHFYAYNQEASRSTYSATISQRDMHEYYLKVFEIPIASGAAAGLMTGYNLANGKPTMTSPELRKLVYEEWVGGYGDKGRTDGDGKYNPPFLVVTDASSPRNLYGSNNSYPNTPTGRAAAYADSLKNGTFAMTTTHVQNADARVHTYGALALGFLTVDELDDVVRTNLTVRFHIGDMDADPISEFHDIFKVGENSMNVPELVSPTYPGGPRSHPYSLLALEAAEKNIVVMKNEGGLLPLSKEAPVAVSGPNASMNSTTFYGGNYPYTTYIDTEIKNKVADPADYSLSRTIYAFKSVRNGGFLTAGTSVGTTLTTAAMTDDAVKGDTAAAKRAQWVIQEYSRNMSHLKSLYYDDDAGARAENWGYVDNRNGLNVQNRPAGADWSPNRATQDWNSRPIIGYWNSAGTNVPWDGTSDLHIALGNSASRVSTRGNGLTAAAANGGAITVAAYSATNSVWTPILIEGDAHAVAKAAAAYAGGGTAVVVVGDQPHLDSRETYDRSAALGDQPLDLAKAQVKLINAVKAAAPGKTVLLIVGSYPFDIDRYKDDPQIGAIVYTSHAGQEQGQAVANVLYGDTAPAGRLGETWYKDHTVLAPLSDFDIIQGKRTHLYADPATVTYPFGYGLTYADFTYGPLTRTGGSGAVANTSEADLTFSVTVDNASSFESDEVVQLYVDYTSGPSILKRPTSKMVDFDRLRVPANGSQVFTFTVPMHEIAIWDVSGADPTYFGGRWYVEPGVYTFRAAKSSADPGQSITITVTGDPIGKRDIFSAPTLAINWDDVSWTSGRASNYGNEVNVISAQENGDFYDQSYAIHSRYDATSTTGLSGVPAHATWVRYNNVDTGATDNMGLTVRASNANTANGTITVYQVEAGAATWTAADRIGAITVPNTGPAAITGSTSGITNGHAQTFANVGVATTSKGIDPAAPDTRYDLIFEFSNANMALKWFQAGPLVNMAPEDIEIQTFHYASESAGDTNAPTVSNANTFITLARAHVLVPPVTARISGALVLEARVDNRVAAASGPRWAVTNGVGTINTSGVYVAPAALGSTVATVEVTFDLIGGGTVSKTIEIENKGLSANDWVQYILMRSGAGNTVNEYAYHLGCYGDYGVIRSYQGSLQITAQSYPNNLGATNTVRILTFDQNVYEDIACTIPSELAEWANAATWGTVQGNPGTQGSVNANEYRGWNRTLRATGMGNGLVYVKVTHAITGVTGVYEVLIENQGEWDGEKGVRDVFDGKDYARIEAELYDASSGANLRVDNIHGNDVGIQINMLGNGNWLRFRNLDFSNYELEFGDLAVSLKYMKILSDVATLTLRLDNPTTGPVIAAWDVRGDDDIRLNWEETPVLLVPKGLVTGIHDVYLIVGWTAAPASPAWITNSNSNATTGSGLGTGLRLGINWIAFHNLTNEYAELYKLVTMVERDLVPVADIYTEASWKAVKTALAIGNVVLQDEEASTEMLVFAFEELDAAVKALAINTALVRQFYATVIDDGWCEEIEVGFFTNNETKVNVPIGDITLAVDGMKVGDITQYVTNLDPEQETATALVIPKLDYKWKTITIKAMAYGKTLTVELSNSYHPTVEYVSIEETSKNSRIWELTFDITQRNTDGTFTVERQSISINANNANVDGKADLGPYTLVYDVKGNGKNIKDFYLVWN